MREKTHSKCFIYDVVRGSLDLWYFIDYELAERFTDLFIYRIFPEGLHWKL